METTITLINKLKRKDSITGKDIWYKSIIEHCAFTKKRVSQMDGTVVSMGEEFTILIPFTDKFLPYKVWKEQEDKTGFYTLSPQDIIIIGIVTEDVTPDNVINIKSDYEPNTCEIRRIEQVEKKLSVTYEFRVGGV